MWEIRLGRTVEACGTNTGAERVQIRFTITNTSGAATAGVLSWLSFDVFVSVAPSLRFTRQQMHLRKASCPLNVMFLNPLNPELNPICYLLALLNK